MKRLKLFLAGLCLTASSFASAGVIYNWQASGYSSEIYNMSGFIELSDAAAGHIDYHAVNCHNWPCDLADPVSPILRFVMRFNNQTPGALDIDVRAGTGYDFPEPSFDANFLIDGDRLRNVSLYINTFISTLRVEGEQVTLFTSDTDNCLPGCAGATGEFVRAAPIPEPGSLALLALAGLGLAAGRRRRLR